MLVQVDDSVPPDAIFSDYAYLASWSDSWVAHARHYAHEMRACFDLGPQSRVVEVASNDGYLLQHFVAMGLPVLGIEPAANVAREAEARGIPTEVAFFGEATAQALVARSRGHFSVRQADREGSSAARRAEAAGEEVLGC